MSRNGSGVYSLPSGNPVVTGTTITSNWANTTLSDIASALTGSLAADGQTTATGSLNMGTYQVKNAADPTAAQDLSTKSYTDGAISTSASVLTAAIAAAVAAALPAGVISMWSGSIASIPSGWYLCNGSNGTPDLRNKFVVAAGSTYAVADTGGSADAITVAHTHTATSTVTDPGHFHTTPVPPTWSTAGAGGITFTSGAAAGGSGYNGVSDSKTTGVTVATTNASTGSSGTNANLPPYYALAYIMKA